MKEKIEKLDKIFEKLRDEWIFVEGKRDKQALQHLGFSKVLTISGNLRQSCRRVDRRVYVLTDLDRRGDQLAKKAKEELESLSVKADIEVRKRVARLLNIRYFEDAERAYEELKGEIYG